MATENLNFIQRQAALAGGQYGRGSRLDVTIGLVPDPDNQEPRRLQRRVFSEALDRALSLLSGEEESKLQNCSYRGLGSYRLPPVWCSHWRAICNAYIES